MRLVNWGSAIALLTTSILTPHVVSEDLALRGGGPPVTIVTVTVHPPRPDPVAEYSSRCNTSYEAIMSNKPPLPSASSLLRSYIISYLHSPGPPPGAGYEYYCNVTNVPSSIASAYSSLSSDIKVWSGKYHEAVSDFYTECESDVILIGFVQTLWREATIVAGSACTDGEYYLSTTNAITTATDSATPSETADYLAPGGSVTPPVSPTAPVVASLGMMNAVDGLGVFAIVGLTIIAKNI